MSWSKSVLVAGISLTSVACVASSGGGGGGGAQDAAAATDTAGADATSLADNTAVSGDSAVGTDAAADGGAGKTDGLGAETTVTDAISPGEISTSDAGAKDTSDADGPADSGPKPTDGGPKPLDGGPAVDGAPTGPYTCETACKNIGAANCPSDDPYDECLAGCNEFLQKANPCPNETIQKFLKCASVNAVVCSGDGSSEPPAACAVVMQEVVTCMGGGPPPPPPPPPDPCKMGACYAGGFDPGNPNAKASCGCESTCNGLTIAFDCDGTECFCSINGAKSPGFPQADACNNPQAAMSTLCGAGVP